MRALFSVVGLLLVVAIIGLLARKQLSSATAPLLPPAAGEGSVTQQAPATPQQQVQQFKSAVEGSLQQARPMPDDTK
jgi:hypothetical protein